MISPIIPRRKIANRQARRQFENESRRISEQLLEIPMSFLRDLFSDLDSDYKALYDEYNTLWIQGCEYCKKLHPRLKICDPNPYFFEITFHPLEHPTKEAWMDNLLKYLRNE